MAKDPYENPKDSRGSLKPPLSLIPATALIHEAIAMRDGAEKYGPYNWRDKRVCASIYTDAAQRHLLAWFNGETNAPDSDAHHLGHARACLGILLDAIECGQLKDDRPKPAPVGEMMTRMSDGFYPSLATLKEIDTPIDDDQMDEYLGIILGEPKTTTIHFEPWIEYVCPPRTEQGKTVTVEGTFTPTGISEKDYVCRCGHGWSDHTRGQAFDLCEHCDCCQFVTTNKPEGPPNVVYGHPTDGAP